jgi:hypothetical protein
MKLAMTQTPYTLLLAKRGIISHLALSSPAKRIKIFNEFSNRYDQKCPSWDFMEDILYTMSLCRLNNIIGLFLFPCSKLVTIINQDRWYTVYKNTQCFLGVHIQLLRLPFYSRSQETSRLNLRCARLCLYY